jgi:hypothetical protein
MTNRSTSIWLLLVVLTFTARFLDGSSSAGCGGIGFSNPNLHQEASVLKRPSFDFGLHGDHKVLDSAGLPLRSGDETSDFEDATPNDKLRSFVLDLASHGPWDGDIKKEKKRFDAIRHRISKIHRVALCPNSPFSNLSLKTLSKWQVFPSISAILRTYNALLSEGLLQEQPALKSLFIRKEVNPPTPPPHSANQHRHPVTDSRWAPHLWCCRPTPRAACADFQHFQELGKHFHHYQQMEKHYQHFQQMGRSCGREAGEGRWWWT